MNTLIIYGLGALLSFVSLYIMYIMTPESERDSKNDIKIFIICTLLSWVFIFMLVFDVANHIIRDITKEE